MKSYTDLEQSKVLAEILPIESADMHYVLIDTDENKYDIGIGNYIGILPHYPAWSLVALLEAMPYEIDDIYFLTVEREGKEYCCCYEDINGNSFWHEFANNPIDACVEMILMLYKEDLL